MREDRQPEKEKGFYSSDVRTVDTIICIEDTIDHSSSLRETGSNDAILHQEGTPK